MERQSLNGDWDFNWYANLDQVPADWHQPKTKIATWDNIPVPGCWQTYGFDRQFYLNTQLPFFYEYDSREKREGFKNWKDPPGQHDQRLRL